MLTQIDLKNWKTLINPIYKGTLTVIFLVISIFILVFYAINQIWSLSSSIVLSVLQVLMIAALLATYFMMTLKDKSHSQSGTLSGKLVFFTLLLLCTIIEGLIRALINHKVNRGDNTLVISYYVNQLLSSLTSSIQYIWILHYYDREIVSKNTWKEKIWTGLTIFMFWYNIVLWFENIITDTKLENLTDDYLAGVMISLTLAGAIEFRLECVLIFFEIIYFPISLTHKEEQEEQDKMEDKNHKVMYFRTFGYIATALMILHESGMVIILYQQIFFKDPMFHVIETIYMAFSITNDTAIVLGLLLIIFMVSGEHAKVSLKAVFYDFVRMGFLLLILFLYYASLGIFKIVKSNGNARYVLIGLDYVSNVIVELFVFVLIVTKYRYPNVKAKSWVAKIYMFLLTYLIWYNYLQAFFDIVYDRKEGIHFPLRSTGLSITITCKTTFAYMLQQMAAKGIEVTDQKVEGENETSDHHDLDIQEVNPPLDDLAIQEEHDE